MNNHACCTIAAIACLAKCNVTTGDTEILFTTIAHFHIETVLTGATGAYAASHDVPITVRANCCFTSQATEKGSAVGTAELIANHTKERSIVLMETILAVHLGAVAAINAFLQGAIGAEFMGLAADTGLEILTRRTKVQFALIA